jgi:hypothetical protein
LYRSALNNVRGDVGLLRSEALGDAGKEIVVSPAYKSHPEFEYFRPLWGFLRKAGIALALISFAVISGALLLSAGHTSIADMTLMTARISEITSVAGWATVTPTAETAEISTAGCEKNTWAYLDGKCIPNRPRKVRSLRSATDKPFGRSGLPVPAASPKSGAITAASAPAKVKSTAQSHPALKKAQKTATRQTSGDDAGKKARKTTVGQISGGQVRKSNSSGREESGRDEGWSARAYALPDSRNAPGLYERSWGWSR